MTRPTHFEVVHVVPGAQRGMAPDVVCALVTLFGPEIEARLKERANAAKAKVVPLGGLDERRGAAGRDAAGVQHPVAAVAPLQGI